VLTYEGTRTVDGVDCYYLKMATNESKIIKYYISISSNDLLMIKGEIPVLGISSLRKVEVELSDYKVVNGLKFPFKMNFSSEGFINGQKNYYKTEEVLVNTDLDLSIFQKPLR
jgi:hypothetical protein